MTTICVDASLAVQRVLFPDAARVQETWDAWDAQGDTLVAPALIFYEVTNVLHRYQRQNWLSAPTCQAALEAALALRLELYNDADLHRRAFELAGRCTLSAAYDSHYLALAERLGAPFYTADQRLYNALKDQSMLRVPLVFLQQEG